MLVGKVDDFKIKWLSSIIQKMLGKVDTISDECLKSWWFFYYLKTKKLLL